MSTITLQIGQCGNQIGEKLFSTIAGDCFESNVASGKNSRTSGGGELRKAMSLSQLHNIEQHKPSISARSSGLDEEQYVSESCARFFSPLDRQDESETRVSSEKSSLLHARSVLVDMESKVVNRLLYSASTRHRWQYRAENCYTQKKGSGNNWSFGYCVNGPSSRSVVEDKIRKEVERCDRLASFLVIMSMAGGTGSGVGSFYTEFIKDNYERATMCNACIWPFDSGEVTLQNYNFLLTLDKLAWASDAIVLVENDTLSQLCKRMQSTASHKNDITFEDMNLVAGHQLASLLQPCRSSSQPNSRTNHMNELAAELCPNDSFKLLSLGSVPLMNKQSVEFSSHQWSGLYRSAKQTMITEATQPNSYTPSKTISMCLLARGPAAPITVDSDPSHPLQAMDGSEHNKLMGATFDSNFVNKYFASRLYGRVMSQPIKLWTSERRFNNYDKSLTVLSNSQSPSFKIDKLVAKAWSMFNAGAYLHHYLKYAAFDEQHMLNAFISAEQIITNYNEI